MACLLDGRPRLPDRVHAQYPDGRALTMSTNAPKARIASFDFMMTFLL
jgi:hypothetical protein